MRLNLKLGFLVTAKATQVTKFQLCNLISPGSTLQPLKLPGTKEIKDTVFRAETQALPKNHFKSMYIVLEILPKNMANYNAQNN